MTKIIPLIMIFMILFVGCKQDHEKLSKNANPYQEWKGVHGKKLAESKPDFIEQH